MKPLKNKGPDRLRAFVEREKAHMNTRFTVAWGDLSWRVRDTKAPSSRRRGRIYFTVHSPRSPGQKLAPFEAPFDGFARAVCNRFAGRRSLVRLGSATSFEQLLTALRFLYAVLPEGLKDPTRLKPIDFVAAQTAIGEHCSGQYVDVIIGKLEAVAAIMDHARLAEPRLRWRRSLNSVAKDQTAQSQDDEKILAELFTDDEMFAWAKLSADPGPDPFDRLRQRLVDLMICGAFRLHEAMTLPFDTLVKEAAYDAQGAPMKDALGEPVLRHGLRYWPHKGNDGACLVKWIPTAMAPIAERAVLEAKAITRRARAVAAAFAEGTTPFDEDPWDTLNPRADYSLTAEDVGWFIGAAANHATQGRSLIWEHKLPMHFIEVPQKSTPSRPAIFKAVWKSDLEALLKQKSFDKYDGACRHGVIPMHECLFVFPYGMRTGRRGFDGTAQLIGSNFVYRYLKAYYPRLAASAASDDVMASHGFRRWLGTMARRGGLAHLDLSTWLGHSEVKSTYAYDLRPAAEKAEAMRQWLAAMTATEDDEIVSPDAWAPEPCDSPIAEGTIGHATAIGTCSHDCQSPPCPYFVKSIDAPEQATLLRQLGTGDLEALLRRLTMLTAQAAAMVAEGIVEAVAWEAANEKWRLRLAAEMERRAKERIGHGAKAA